ncbi:M4 family metallopeptidase [Paenibacillus sp. BC26]|uniref:M4 family metallopeptidase n=1 Tax=Paenibacillus sp. BC26 TaxID=1881032 RepID=UPI0015A58D65|nr:M4 family metallopeptidase [Paenibacillus sp. BC26]
MSILSTVAFGGLTSASGAEAGDALTMHGNLATVTAASDQEVSNYLSSNKAKLGLKGVNQQFMLKSKTSDEQGQSHLLYQVKYNGIPVYGQYTRVHLSKTKQISSVQNEIEPSSLTAMPKATTPKLTGSEAIQALQTDLEAQLGRAIVRDDDMADPAASLIIYPYKGTNRLAYETTFHFLYPEPGNWVGYVDAISGQVLDKYNKIAHAETSAEQSGTGEYETRTLNVLYEDESQKYYMVDMTKPMFDNATFTGFIGTYNAASADEVSSPISSSAAFTDADAVDAHFYSGVVYDYYLDKYGRNSIDDKGMSMYSAVHYTPDGLPYDNAFWNGQGMVYGDGSGVSNGGFDCFSCSLDVVGHEITHGVTERTAGLEYRHQSGALNEAISDIVGALIEMDFRGQTNWELGEDTGYPIRDMEDPKKYDQPEIMNEFQYTTNTEQGDYGGVHINSGIVNHAAFLIATGIDALGGLDGKQVLGELTYNVLLHRLTPVSNFEDARDAFVAAATELYGANPAVVQVVKDAWTSVGLPYGQHFDVTSISSNIEGASPANIDENSSEIYIDVPVGTDLSTFSPTITVSQGATLEPLDEDYSDGFGLYDVKAQGTSVEWAVFISENELASLNYTGNGFMEANEDDGSVGSMTGSSEGLEISLSHDVFNGEVGDDFIASGKAVVTNIPSGLKPHVMVVDEQTVVFWLEGNAASHTNRDDIGYLSLHFMDLAFYNSYLYMVINNHKDDFIVDFKHSLHFADSTDSTVTLTWPAASQATAIQILQSEDGGVTWDNANTSADIGVNDASATVTGLLPNKQYGYKLVISGGEDEGESVQAAGYTLSENQAPIVANRIQEKNVFIDGPDVTVPLAGVFTDEDSDVLSYTAVSSEEDTATVGVSGDSLVLHAVGAGIATVTVTANDGHGHQVDDHFSVVVDVANHAPTIAAVIADQTATVGASDVTVQLAGVFADQDGDTLSYTAVSDTAAVATVSVSGSAVTLHPVSAGTATITVTADDGHHHTVTDVFQITVSSANNGGSGGGGLFFATEPEVTINDDGIAIGKSAIDGHIETNADGTQRTVYSINAAAWNKAVGLLAKSEDKKIHIDLGQTKGKVDVELPVNSVADAQEQSADTVISISTDTVSYDLPLSVLKLDELLKSFGAAESQANVIITMQPVSDDMAEQLQLAAEQGGGSLVGTPVEFEVTVSFGEKEVEIHNFGNQYVSRSITLLSANSKGSLTAVLFDPQTGAMTFIPATFEVENGKTIVTIKRNGNSIYAIIQNKKSFADVPAGHWAKEDIELLASKLVIKGASDTSFKPNGSITRAEFTSLLVRSLGLTPDKGAAAVFSDVHANAWFSGEVGAAVKAGIVKGNNDATFQPQATITREQMAVMVANALHFVGKDKQLSQEKQAEILSSFDDGVTVAVYAQTAVAELVDAGIVNGITAELYAPDVIVNRAQAAVILKRLLQYMDFLE